VPVTFAGVYLQGLCPKDEGRHSLQQINKKRIISDHVANNIKHYKDRILKLQIAISM